jgi:hypothetical protein
MANSTAIKLFGKAIKDTLLLWALPRIAELKPGEWAVALKRARDTNFDMIERVGVLAGIVFTTYLLRFDASSDDFSLPGRFFAQFVAAVPLLILFSGPFYLRCMRRGLDHVIESRQPAG